METVCRFDGEPWGQVAGSALQMARSGSDKWHGQIVTFGRVACAHGWVYACKTLYAILMVGVAGIVNNLITNIINFSFRFFSGFYI